MQIQSLPEQNACVPLLKLLPFFRLRREPNICEIIAIPRNHVRLEEDCLVAIAHP